MELFADDTKLARGLKRAQQRLNAWGAGVRNAGLKLAAVGAAVLGPMLAATMAFARAGDALDKMSARTGVSVEALSQLDFAATQNGTSIDELEKSIFRMQRSIGDAANGSATATQALAALGLTAAQLQRLAPEEQFLLIADRLNDMRDESTRAAVGQALLGRGFAQLLPLIKNGSAGIRAYMQQADRLGLTWSTEMANNARDFTDRMDIMRRVMTMSGRVIGSVLAPHLTRIMDRITKAAIIVNRFVRENSAMILTIAKVAAAVVGLGAAIITLGVGLQIAAFSLGGFMTALAVIKAAAAAIVGLFAAMLSPVGLTIAAVLGLGAAILHVTGAGAAALKWLGDHFGPLAQVASDTFSGMRDALAGGDIILAAKVLWAGLKLAWEQGVAPLRSIWADFRFAFESMAVNAFAGVQSAWIKVRDWFYEELPQFTKTVATIWTKLGHIMQDVIESIIIGPDTPGQFSEREWNEFRRTGVRPEDQRQVRDAANQFKQEQRQRELDLIEERAGMTPGERAARQAVDLAEIEDDRLRAIGDLSEAHNKRVQDAADALQAARDELERLRKEAAQRRVESVGELEIPKRAIADIALDALDTATRSVSVSGTFSAAAVAGLGSGDMAERTAKASEETAKNTGKIVRMRATFS